MATNSEPPRVLCVDDDAGARHALERQLREAGLTAVGASGGADAIAKAVRQPPDLVLLDVRMPGLDGYQVCTRLQANEMTAGIPVVFVTALTDPGDRTRAFAAGAVGFLTKPVDTEELLAHVWKHLGTGVRWKAFHEGTSRARRFDFAGFRQFLAGHVDLPQEAKDALASLAAPALFEFARVHGLAEASVARLAAEYLGLAYADEIPHETLALGVLPPQFCRANRVAAVEDTDGTPIFVTENPFRYEIVDLLRLNGGDGGVPSLRVAPPAVISLLLGVDERDGPRPSPLAATSREQRVEAVGRVHKPRPIVSLKESDETVDVGAEADAPAIQLVNTVIANGVRARASDIHIEPREGHVDLRYRIDGMLVARPQLPKEMQGSVVSRLKIMARLDIAERRVPQDGRTRVLLDGRHVDLRVSTLPTRHGEKVVLRILDRGAVNLDLAALGFEDESLALLRQSIAKPHGILLVTGPTGSGKTTTLYSALTAISRPHVNVVTVEDPIEYDLPRINQVQVHPPAGLTFPVALRAILRQDPDIIMVGEIRDGETLDIAMKAALTGHLVLSTLHTNDAASTVPRLIDMGSEPFLVASTVEMITAQRLLRRLCPRCKEPAPVPGEVLERFRVPFDSSARFFHPKGCDSCDGTGYSGRLAVAEVLVLDDAMRLLVAKGADEGALRHHALEVAGMSTLRQNALRKAVQGLTTLEEILRVTA